MVTVAGVTRAHAGILEEVGGPAYLTQLLTAMVGVVNVGSAGVRSSIPGCAAS